jgi:microcompartment protein PduB
MDKNEIVNAVMSEIENRKTTPLLKEAHSCGLTEFVGTALGDTIGLVIPNVDAGLQERLGFDKRYKSLGIYGGRVGAGPQAMACDEAVKSSNTTLLSFEMARDTKGGGGHGCLAIFGAEEVSDAKRAVEIALSTLPRFFETIYMNEAGHVEIQYTARASHVLNTYLKAPLGKSWGMIVGCPAALGVVASDAALKSADIELVMHASPSLNTSFTNEFMIMYSGDSGAVKQACNTGEEIGLALLRTLGSEPVSGVNM